MKRIYSVLASFILIIGFMLTSTAVEAGYCYAKFDGEDCDTRTRSNCVVECFPIGEFL